MRNRFPGLGDLIRILAAIAAVIAALAAAWFAWRSGPAPAPSPSPVAALTATVPATPESTATARPTRTSAPPTDTFTPTPEATPEPGSLAYNVSQLSAQGDWIVQLEVSEPVTTGEGEVLRENVYTVVRLINRVAQIDWTAIAEWGGYGVGYAPPQVVHWFADETSLLLADFSLPDGCPGFGVYDRLRRLDLVNQAVTLVGDNLRGILSISPDEQHLAGVAHTQVVVHSLASGQETVVPFLANPGFAASGNIVWSPDSAAFVFVSDHSYCGAPDATTVWRYNLADEQIAPLLDQHPGRYRIASWLDTDVLVLSNGRGGRLLADANTGAVLDSP